ncbi:MAG: hypothetical protein LBU66_07685, partial [Treponema sp.]|nr:hypothetical protein [Treponema sp.]
RTERYDNAVSSLKRGLKQIKEAAEEGADISRRTLKRLSYAASADTLNPSQQSKILKQLDEITQRITNSEVKEVAGFLFPPVEDSPPPANADPFRAYLESSLRVFMSLGEAAGDLKDFN